MKLAAMNSTIGNGEAAFDRAKALGLQGVEVGFAIRPLVAGDRQQLDESLRASARTGVAVASAVLGEHNNGGIACWWKDAVEMAHEIRVALDSAAAVGAGVLLVPFFFFNEPKGAAHRRVVADRLKPLCDHAAEVGVRFAYEGVNTAEELLEMAAVIDNDSFGVYYDPANAAWCDRDVIAEVKLLGKKLFRTHIKEAATFTGDGRLGNGRVDHAAYAAALRSIGYDDWYTLETPNGTDEEVAADIAFARKVYTA